MSKIVLWGALPVNVIVCGVQNILYTFQETGALDRLLEFINIRNNENRSYFLNTVVAFNKIMGVILIAGCAYATIVS